jgi:16S rRNA (cytidine1402-2'-O)-methyltransferase
VPGATAIIAGLVASGLPTDSFLFAGFLPSRKQARRARLNELKAERATLVFYEAGRRIRESLLDVREILGDRRAAVARELTKLHEQFIRGAVSEIIAHFEANEPRGEMTLVIAGSREDNLGAAPSISVSEEVERLERERGLSRIEAIKQAARSRGLSKREAYQLLLDERESNDDENIG